MEPQLFLVRFGISWKAFFAQTTWYGFELNIFPNIFKFSGVLAQLVEVESHTCFVVRGQCLEQIDSRRYSEARRKSDVEQVKIIQLPLMIPLMLL